MTGHAHPDPEPHHHTSVADPAPQIWIPPHLRKSITTSLANSPNINTPPLTRSSVGKGDSSVAGKAKGGDEAASALAGKVKERNGRMGKGPGKGPGKRASSGFVKRVKNSVTNSVTSSAKAGDEGWEVEEDGEESEGAHGRTGGLLTAQLSERRVAQVSSQSVVSGQPRTTTINGALGTSTGLGLQKPHRVFEGEEYEAYTNPTPPEFIVQYPGPYAHSVPPCEMRGRYKLGSTVLDNVDLEDVEKKQTVYPHAVIHNVRVYLRTVDEKRVDREGRAEDDRHDRGSWGGMSGEFGDLRGVRRQRSDRELVTKE